MCAKQGKSEPMKPTKTEPKNQTAAVQEIVKQRANGQPQAAVPEPAQAEPSALVVQDATTLGEMSTVTSAGRLMLFNCQTGVYSTHDDGEEVPQGSEFIAHADSAIHGWIRFDPDGGPITRLWAATFPTGSLPLRSSLREMDQSAWKIGLSGGPEDPWKQTAKLPLEDAKSGAFFTLSGNNQDDGARHLQVSKRVQALAQAQPGRPAGDQAGIRHLQEQVRQPRTQADPDHREPRVRRCAIATGHQHHGGPPQRQDPV